MSPGLLLGVLFALIGAQVTRLVAPRRLGYPVALALAAAGVVAGELAALGLHAGGPPLGPLHPLADALGIAVLEVVGATLSGPPAPAGGGHNRSLDPPALRTGPAPARCHTEERPCVCPSPSAARV